MGKGGWLLRWDGKEGDFTLLRLLQLCRVRDVQPSFLYYSVENSGEFLDGGELRCRAIFSPASAMVWRPQRGKSAEKGKGGLNIK